MTSTASVLWRFVLTASTLLLLASCGIEQSTPTVRPSGTEPIFSPPVTTSGPRDGQPTPTAAFPSSPVSSPTAPTKATLLAATLAAPATPTRSSPLAVTLADNGKTIPLAVGQTFLLRLAPEYKWTVTVDNPVTVQQVQSTSGTDNQGLYQAVKAGTTGLHATGVMICPPGKACIQIALEFTVQLAVK